MSGHSAFSRFSRLKNSRKNAWYSRTNTALLNHAGACCLNASRYSVVLFIIYWATVRAGLVSRQISSPRTEFRKLAPNEKRFDRFCDTSAIVIFPLGDVSRHAESENA